MTFTLPDLSYTKDSLEPHIDKQTMEIHHGKHHNAYINNLNGAIEGTELSSKSLESLIQNIQALPTNKQNAIRNNGGGHYNHSLFWKVIGPNKGGEPTGKLREAMDASFGNFENFKSEFETAAKTRFGSGWAWLIKKDNGDLAVTSTPNQDNPLMDVADHQGTPLLGLDVWEHAYYLNYQNRRPDYVAAFWNIVNWDEVSNRYEA